MWAGSGAKVTTLPPKWVQSTDLLGKDNLGRKVLNHKVSDLTDWQQGQAPPRAQESLQLPVPVEAAQEPHSPLKGGPRAAGEARAELTLWLASFAQLSR